MRNLTKQVKSTFVHEGQVYSCLFFGVGLIAVLTGSLINFKITLTSLIKLTFVRYLSLARPFFICNKPVKIVFDEGQLYCCWFFRVGVMINLKITLISLIKLTFVRDLSLARPFFISNKPVKIVFDEGQFYCCLLFGVGIIAVTTPSLVITFN